MGRGWGVPTGGSDGALLPVPHFHCALNEGINLQNGRRRICTQLGFAVALPGIKTAGVVRCDQPRVLDIEARRGRRADVLPEEILAEVMARVVTLFE
jgi:hypothetical protein